MAVKKVIEIDVDVLNAQGGIDGLIKSFDQAEKSTKSLKQQMREAQNEVAELSEKFGATSEEAVKAAKRAGELRDRIGDAKSLTEAFNPDAKFNALSSSLGGVASGFAAYQGALSLAGVESKDLEQQLLRVQSAMALAQGLQGLGEARDSFKQLKAVAIDAFKGIKTAIGSTGIGLLVIALGTIYAYWDDIKEAVSGVSEEQKKLNADSQENVNLQNEKLKTIGAQDNILKLQGKSEKEILAIKIKQTDEAILATEINQKNQIQTNKLAVEGAQRNYELLKSYIDFVSTPLRFLYKTGAESINGIIDLLNKIPGINIKSKLDETLGDKAADYLAKLGFDPEQVKADGEATIKESQEALLKLKNDRAGSVNAINEINKKAAKDQQEILLEQRKKQLEAINEQAKTIQENSEKLAEEKLKKDIELKKKADEILKQIDAELAPEETPQQKLQREYEERLKILTDAGASTLALEAKFVSDKFALKKLEIEEQNKYNQQLIDSEENVKNAKKNALNESLNILQDFAGKNKGIALAILAVQKGLAIAEIISNASKGIAVSQANLSLIPAILPPGIPNPAYPFAVASHIKNVAATKIGAATSIATILAQGISSAKSTLGGNAGAGASAPSGGGGAGGASAPTFNVVGNAGVNQIATTLGKEQPPVQAFVVSKQMTNQQEMDRNIVKNATL
jgi:chromosome segregation ATPase